jgi:hypothetical protein
MPLSLPSSHKSSAGIVFEADEFDRFMLPLNEAPCCIRAARAAAILLDPKRRLDCEPTLSPAFSSVEISPPPIELRRESANGLPEEPRLSILSSSEVSDDRLREESAPPPPSPPSPPTRLLAVLFPLWGADMEERLLVNLTGSVGVGPTDADLKNESELALDGISIVSCLFPFPAPPPHFPPSAPSSSEDGDARRM